MTDGPEGVGEWIVFCAAMTGLGILGLLILSMGVLAVTLTIKLWRDIWRYGL